MDPGKNHREDEDPASPATPISDPIKQGQQTPILHPNTSNIKSSSKGVENAKKRLRAFSIQKKTPKSPIVVPKATGSGNTTVLIGKLSSIKVSQKVEDPEQKKQPKPPKPGQARKSFQESYTELQRKTLSEIEDMKRKMELVELGIPLGLICPTSTSEKAMPTKAMPPIKSFLDPAKVDEIIREAKKAKLAGKEFKFDYHKLLPDYANPFQKKKEEAFENDRNADRRKSEIDKEKDKRKSDKYDSRRQEYRKDENKYKERDRDKVKDKRIRNDKFDESKKIDKTEKETDLNLNDYLVCDSWSLDNDDKNTLSPSVQDNSGTVQPSTSCTEIKASKSSEYLKASTVKKPESIKKLAADKSLNAPVKIKKLKPVIDSFKFEIDPNDDEILDIFDEDSGLEKYAQTTSKKKSYDSTDKIDYDIDISKDTSLDSINDDTFLESVINEIKQEGLSDEGSQDKALVEYELSPIRDDSSTQSKPGSITPEIVDKGHVQSERSDYSKGYKSSDSYKTPDTSESGYKSVETYRVSVEKELEEGLESKISKSTVDSLETWSFVLKICQPLLFRHDKNKCYKETRVTPKIWYTENPKCCSCVKDRSVVYEELEMFKMNLVDRVYGCDQIPDSPFPTVRCWYPRNGLSPTENNTVPLSYEWEAEDPHVGRPEDRRSATPQRTDELSLDREYQRFMEAVWPDVADKVETSRSTTPVKQESRKKKKEENKDIEDKKTKKIKLSSEGWSQESDIDEDQDKNRKMKIEKEKVKSRKRKYSTSSSSSSSDSSEDTKKKRKLMRKKAVKKTKSKSAKRRRMGRKLLKKLKQKENKKRIQNKDSEDDVTVKKKGKRIKKKQEKSKKRALKKKRSKVETSSSSSSSSDSSSSESSSDRRSKKTKKRTQERKKKMRKQRKQSSSDSTQSDELFDVNILNNIKTERLTDDEKAHKMMEFSPRRQKPREIINVKELQNDFVGNIHIKQETDDVAKVAKEAKVVDYDRANVEPVQAKEESELPKESLEPQPLQPEEPPVTVAPVPPVSPALLESPAHFLALAPPVPIDSSAHVVTRTSQEPPANFVARTPQEPPAHSVARTPQDSPAHFVARTTQESPAHFVARTPQESPAHFVARTPQESPAHFVARTPQESPAHFVARTPQESPAHFVARTSQESPAHFVARTPKESHAHFVARTPQESPAHFVARTPLEPPAHLLARTPLVPYAPSLPLGSPAYLAPPAPLEPLAPPAPEESNTSQGSSQESVGSGKDVPMYEKDESHLRPSSQNSNYSFNDVINASQNVLYQKGIETELDSEDKYSESYETPNYEMYEQLAMAYQSDVASQRASPPGTDAAGGQTEQRIETVVRARCGEIKCDWRPGHAPAPAPAPRPSRWGLKPSEVNIVLTGEETHFPVEETQPIYQIQSIANRTDVNSGYDEAYMDMYGASDRLQYGDCFAPDFDTDVISANIAVMANDTSNTSMGAMVTVSNVETRTSSLDARINQALRETVLGEVANEVEPAEPDKDAPEKGILITNIPIEPRGSKRVSFADGYKPGQDSDVEEPPIKKSKRARRTGCAWPCPAAHADHVPLWDALPPPPPPPGSPPPARRAAPPAHLLRAPPRPPLLAAPLPHPAHKFDPSIPVTGFMPPEPPPGLITLQ